jgi:hypothetical protein
MSHPGRAQYETALRALGPQITEKDIALLDAFRSRPGAKATATELAEMLGYVNYRPANRAVGRLGKKIGEAIPGFRPARRDSDGTPMWWSVIAGGETRASDGHFVWILHPDLLAALDSVGI